MAANGKGNGKTGDGGAAAQPVHTDGKAPNGKAPNGKRPPLTADAEPPEAHEAGAQASLGESNVEEAQAAFPSTDPAPEPGPVSSGGSSSAEAPGEGAGAAPPPHRGAEWGRPLASLERRWTWLESRLITFVLLSQILSLVAWVCLKGLSEPVTTAAGTAFRAVLVAIALGAGTWFGARKQAEPRRTNLTLTALAVAIALVILWHRGAAGAHSIDGAVVKYFDNVKGWLQDGSTLTLLGGLRGLVTRLTLWLALLGGSLATASGKHIHIDVLFRFLPRKLRAPIAIVNYVFAATVCLAAVRGFFDHIAITSYGANEDDRAGVKVDIALHHIGDHAFFTRKQLGLDLRTLPHVLKGERYDEWMTAADWNEWLDGAGFDARWEPAKVAGLHITEGTHSPFVVSPDGETTRGALAHTLGLVFPFGLLAIALRFLLRALLVESGYFEVDPDEVHKAEIGGAS